MRKQTLAESAAAQRGMEELFLQSERGWKH